MYISAIIEYFKINCVKLTSLKYKTKVVIKVMNYSTVVIDQQA